MDQEFALNLRLARRRSGLTQADCAHLLGVDRSIVAKLENGTVTPSVVELATLSLIYDLPPEAFGEELQIALLPSVTERLATLPKGPRQWRASRQRARTLSSLAERLEILSTSEDD